MPGGLATERMAAADSWNKSSHPTSYSPSSPYGSEHFAKYMSLLLEHVQKDAIANAKTAVETALTDKYNAEALAFAAPTESKAASAAAKYNSTIESVPYAPPMESKPASAFAYAATPTYHPVAEYIPFTRSKELEKPEDTKFTIRVTVCSTEDQCRQGAHEVVEIDANSTLPALKKIIKRQFRFISNLGGDKKVNLKGVHISDEKVSKIKVMYAGANTWDVGCDSVPETVLTEENCVRTLQMLKHWAGRDTLCHCCPSSHCWLGLRWIG